MNLAYPQLNRSAICRIPVYSASPKAKRTEFRAPDLVETYISYKRESEVDAVRLRPHPHEFALYYDA